MSGPGPRPANPDHYVRSLDGWQRERVAMLRSIAVAVGGSEETVKWGHLVYMANGPAFLIRAEQHRVLLGFWRGKRLLAIEPRMSGAGKYEMRSLQIREADAVEPQLVERLVREAIELNRALGDPTRTAR